MNVSTDEYTFVWQNINYVNWKNNRVYFTSGDMLKMTDEEAIALKEALVGVAQGGQNAGGTGTT